MANNCSKRSVIAQYGPTCWANAVMTALFYSDGMHKLLLEKMPSWKKTDAKKVIRDIITQHFTHKNHEYMAFFDKMRPETLLRFLHKENPKLFEHDPDKKSGYFSGRYLYKLMNYLGITDFALLDALETNDQGVYDLFFGQYNVMDMINGFKKFKKANKAETDAYLARNPDVLLIMTKKKSDSIYYPEHYYKQQVSFKPIITYNGYRYVADSIIMSNYNQYKCHMGHEIAGVTCNNKRYVYNGWIARTVDTGIKEKIFSQVPCSLMPHDWLDTSKPGFCLDTAKCNLKYLSKNNTNTFNTKLCFSFTSGPRNYIYIREDLLQTKPKVITPKAITPKVITPKVITPKVITPKVTTPKVITPKVITPKVITPKVIKKVIKKVDPTIAVPTLSKECPPDKIMNPITKRCVSKTGAIGKKLLSNLLNQPTTQLPIKHKECPPDKILNPVTNRCVNKNGAIGKKLQENKISKP